jgi:hypothetical protein
LLGFPGISNADEIQPEYTTQLFEFEAMERRGDRAITASGVRLLGKDRLWRRWERSPAAI